MLELFYLDYCQFCSNVFYISFVTLPYNNVCVTVSSKMSGDGLLELSPKTPFETKHLLDLVCILYEANN